jgi:hypothetical protein
MTEKQNDPAQRKLRVVLEHDQVRLSVRADGNASS